MSIINLTQHAATAEQLAAGVVDLPADQKAVLQVLLTFDDIPSADDIHSRAAAVAALAKGHKAAMIGGALWLMGPLASALRAAGVHPVFAFSRRESVEQTQPDGSVKKVQVFRHAGFVEAA